MHLHSIVVRAAGCGMVLLHAVSVAQELNPASSSNDRPTTTVIRRADPATPFRNSALSGQDEPTGPRSTIPGIQIGIGLGTGAVSSGDLYGLKELSFSVAKAFSDDEAGAVFFLMQKAPVQHTSRLNASLDGGVTIIGLGGDYRFYRTPSYTFIGHYLSAGITIQALFWEYLNELQLPKYDDQDVFIGYEGVKHDVLLGFDLHGGIGFDIGQIWDFHLEGEASPGVIFWSGKSAKGFNNSLFKPFFYLKGRVMARLVL